MPITDEAKSLYGRACDMINQSGDDLGPYKDVAALLQLAIKKGGGIYADAETKLAWVYFCLKDMEKAQRYAQSALLAEPESYEAQKIIVACAAVNLPGFFANMKFKGELKKLVKLFLKQCAGGVTDSDFNYYLNQLLQVAEFGAQRGTGSLHFVYEAVISVPIDRIQKTNIKDTELVGQQRLIAEARLNT